MTDRRLTELGGSQNPLVEQNDTRTQSNPQTRLVLESKLRALPAYCSSGYTRNVESRVEARAGGSGIVVAALELAVILGGATVCHC